MNTLPLPEYIDAIGMRLLELQEIVEDKFGEYSYPECDISYDLDSSRTLGRHSMSYAADGYHHLIELNPKLLNEYGHEYIENVFVHEYAHAVVETFYGPCFENNFKKPRPHGKEFKEVCRWFGIDGSATSSLFNNSKTMKKRRSTKRWLYACGCQDFKLSTLRHNKMTKGIAKYSCKKCKEQLVFQEELQLAS